MDILIKNIIEEKFVSKAQQKYFYAKANDKTLSSKERKKWKQMASEFSEKTNFKKLPNKIEEKDITEFVDETGSIIGKNGEKSKRADFVTKNVTSDKTTDQAVYMAHGAMGNTATTGFGRGTLGPNMVWENDFSKVLGDDIIKNNMSYKEGFNHLKKMGLDDDEVKERLEQMGLTPDLPKGKLNLIEKYIDEILVRRKNQEEFKEVKEINPIIKKQINVLKTTLKNNNLSIEDILKNFKDDE